MNKSLNQVKEFHELFNHPIGEGAYSTESLTIRQLRIKLLFEELAELAEAGDVRGTMQSLCKKYADVINESGQSETLPDGDDVDKLEELDALCDIQYVLNGKILTSGLQEVFDKSFDTVHNNNMNKAHSSVEHANETIINSLEGKGSAFEKTVYGTKFWIVENESRKVIKPWDHVKVKLSLD